MKTLNWKIALVIALSIGLGAGCAKSREKKGGEVRVGRGAVSPGVTPTGDPGTGGTFTPQYGDITPASENAVEKLVSATMDPQTDMQLPIYGIAMAGNVQVNGTSNVLAIGSGTAQILASSEFAMYIIDEIAHSGQNSAITIGFKQGVVGATASGRIFNGGQVELTFHDNYGDVYLNGTYNSSRFTGQVSFQNSAGPHAGERVTLGSFSVPTCGFFHCQ